MQFQLFGMELDGTNKISIINFFQSFQTAFITNEVHEDASKWLLQFFLKGATRSLINSRLNTGARGAKNTQRSRCNKGRSEETIETYTEAVQLLFVTY